MLEHNRLAGVVRSPSSRPVNSMPVAVAITSLLQTAQAQEVSEHAAATGGDKPAVMRKIEVEAAEEVADGPVEGYHATRSATGTRTDAPIELTPMSVQVVSRAVMDDQQVLTLGDAIKNVSGVYTRQGPDGNTADAFNIRGFQVHSYGGSYLDGVKDYSRAPKETAGLERIEVLKGPAAIMYGRIEPGGMINRVSKRPQAGQLTEVRQQFGSDNFFRTTLDSTGAIDQDQSWLYRINLAGEDSEGFKDNTDNRRVYIAPQIEWRPGERTSIRAGVEYLDNDRSWALTYGTIGNANGPVDAPISNNFHDNDDRYEDESLTWQLAWSHAFNDDWKVQQRFTYVDRSSVAQGSLLSAADLQGNYTRTYWGWEDENAYIASTNIDLTGRFSTGPVSHTVLAGIDYFDEDYDSGGWASGGTPQPSNVYNPNNSDAPYDLSRTVAQYWYANENLGVYLQDQMAMLDDRLHVLVGLRYDNADYTTFFGTSGYTVKDDAPTWRAGLLYQVRRNVSVYASYVEGFGTSNYSSATGEKFDPQTSHQTEIGTKIELPGGLGLTIAAFQLVKDNLTMADPADVTRIILAGEATSEGVELDIGGQITRNWNVIASYAYTDVRYTRSDRFQGERLHSIPRHGASLWNTYRFGDSGWHVGGGVTHRSERLGMQRATNPALYPYMMDDYTLLDLMVGYEFTLSDLLVKTQINASNATDERYYPSTYGSAQRIALGAPRNILASVSVSF